MPARKGPTKPTNRGTKEKDRDRSHRITLKQAAALTKRYRKYAEPSAEKGGLFNRHAIERLLAQPGCTGLRYYHGRQTDGRYAIVLVAVDEKGNDMERGLLLENHFPCPPFCGGDGELNS